MHGRLIAPMLRFSSQEGNLLQQANFFEQVIDNGLYLYVYAQQG
jgi:hypothetical protein